MPYARTMLVLMSAAMLATACGSDEGDSSAVTTDEGECTPIGVECQFSNGFDEAVCHDANDTKRWYRVCGDAECKTGRDFYCNGTDCDDAVNAATDACNPV